MTRQIFVNLPVSDLAAARRFYEALGFEHNPQFSDEQGAAMVWSEAIFVMLLTHPKWQSFTKRPMPPKGSSEVMLAITLDSRDAVTKAAEAATANGGEADVNPPQDHGFMCSRAIADPDGHVWEAVWMDMSAMESQAQSSG